MKPNEWKLEEIIHDYLDEDSGWDLYNKTMDWHKLEIKKALAQKRKQLVEEVGKMRKNIDSRNAIQTRGLGHMSAEEGYNQALSDILAKLKEESK